MNINDYQAEAKKTAVYPSEYRVIYPTLGLCGEAGEVAEKIKKILRDCGGIFTEAHRESIKKELGDVYWYLAALADDLDMDSSEVLQANLDKLHSRQERGKLSGSGDNR